MSTSSNAGARETGWLPDFLYTGGRFEPGLAFFADPLGKITRFSREAADLAAARRLNGQAVLPGMVDTYCRVLDRRLRGRGLAAEKAVGLKPEEVREIARMVFVEQLLSGATCVAAFFPCAAQEEERGGASREILRAAREIGIRVALAPAATPECAGEAYLRELEALRLHVQREYPGDECWLAAGLERGEAIAAEALKGIGQYAHGQRLRVLAPLPLAGAGAAGRMLRQLAQAGLLDKRLVAIHAADMQAEEMGALGAARAALCICPSDTTARGQPLGEVEAALAAGINLALGTGCLRQAGLLNEGRQVVGRLGGGSPAERAARLLHILATGGARSLGAPSGALEVGRPADFFTVNLYDPSIAGADQAGLAEAVAYALERRGVRDVWIGGRQRLVGGRHAQQGPVVARFAEMVRRWEG